MHKIPLLKSHCFDFYKPELKTRNGELNFFPFVQVYYILNMKDLIYVGLITETNKVSSK
jgi:hypothetical protein